MSEQEIARVFHKTFNGKLNVMSPQVIEYGATPKNLLYELSKGEFLGKTFYAVTLLMQNGELPKDEKSRGGFETIEDAREFISEV